MLLAGEKPPIGFGVPKNGATGSVSERRERQLADTGGRRALSGKHNAGLLMIAGVALYSLFPLVVDMSMGAHDSPWMFQMGSSAGKVVSVTLYLAAFYPRLFDKERLLWLGKWVLDWSVLWRPRRAPLIGRIARPSSYYYWWLVLRCTT